MKKLLILGLLGLSATAFGQVCEVDLVYRNSQILRTFRAYGDPSSCQEGMKECRKAIRFDYSSNPQYPSTQLDCVRAGGQQTPTPNPQPNPYPQNPYPQNPYPSYGVSVTGVVEDAMFTISGRDAADLYFNCLSDIRRVMYGGMDELMFTANNNRFVSTSTSGYYNDTQICSILEQEARRSIQPAYTSFIRVVGSLEREPFQIQANDRAELLSQCVSAFTATRQGATDEVTFSVNGAPFQRLTTSGWWNTPARACKAMLLNIDAQIR